MTDRKKTMGTKPIMPSIAASNSLVTLSMPLEVGST
jgi:hypothetical protein